MERPDSTAITFYDGPGEPGGGAQGPSLVASRRVRTARHPISLSGTIRMSHTSRRITPLVPAPSIRRTTRIDSRPPAMGSGMTSW